jgi:hypothetical protein
MATTDVAPEKSHHATVNGPAAEDVCLACAHPWSGHDVISARFCTATIASALTRGCICPAG